jgi:uncharacterized protein with von Willebrand factor type A (vWA) domain
MAPTGFQSLAPAQAANAPFHLLAELTRELWLPSLVCSSGDTAQRLNDLPLWERALQAGQLPTRQHDFGDPDASAAMRQAMEELGLTELTQGSAAMTKQVLRAVLWHLDRLIDRPVSQSRASAIESMMQDFRAEWTLQRQGWEEVLVLFQSLGDLANLRWNELRGRLNSREWNEARRIGELLLHLKELTAFIDRIGRAQRQDDLPPSARLTPSADTPQALAAVAIETHLVDQPSEVRGVKRSAQIARMLANEAAMIGHPLLHRLWQARFAEQQLLTYEDEAVLTQWRLQPDTTHLVAATTQPEPLGHGPIIVCLDTSGSMRGAPENVAKACVLQALRSAHAAQRACRLLAFGGVGELLEQELALSPAGLQALLDLMGQSFDGGTDVQTPLERAIALVRSQSFALADILIVSDGEFGVTPATRALLIECKATLGLRVHSILIGDRETLGLLEISDQIHWVRAWRRYATLSRDAHADGYSPVHSSSLTAMYFPNAIRRPPPGPGGASGPATPP